jgi:hypothetical protein
MLEIFFEAPFALNRLRSHGCHPLADDCQERADPGHEDKGPPGRSGRCYGKWAVFVVSPCSLPRGRTVRFQSVRSGPH